MTNAIRYNNIHVNLYFTEIEPTHVRVSNLLAFGVQDAHTSTPRHWMTNTIWYNKMRAV